MVCPLFSLPIPRRYCNQCKDHVCAHTKSLLWRLPQILIIQLKRFAYSKSYGRYSNSYYYEGNKKKISTLVEFPLENLDLRPYLAPEIQTTTENTLYDLLCVANHTGGANFGHYYAYCRDDNDGTPRWFEYNDSCVSEMRPSEVCKPTAYVLIYRRKDHCLKSCDLLHKLSQYQDELKVKQPSFFSTHFGYNKQEERDELDDDLYDDKDYHHEDENLDMDNEHVDSFIHKENDLDENLLRSLDSSPSLHTPPFHIDSPPSDDQEMNEPNDETVPLIQSSKPSSPIVNTDVNMVSLKNDGEEESKRSIADSSTTTTPVVEDTPKGNEEVKDEVIDSKDQE